jgi:hypothetical protein
MAGRDHLLNFLPALAGVLFATSSLPAQQNPNPRMSTIEFSLGGTHILRHSDALLFPSSGPGFSIQAGVSQPVSGKEPWHSSWKQAALGANIIVAHFGNNRVLGQAAGVFPSLRLPVMSGQNFSLDFEIGSGIAYTTKFYNKISNPSNNALSTPWNNVTQLRWIVRPVCFHRASWFFTVQLTHFSNGHIRLPNKGINQAGLSFGYALPFRRILKDPDYRTMRGTDTVYVNPTAENDPSQKRRWRGETLAGVGFTEYSFQGGPSYRTCFFAGAASYRYQPQLSLLAGAEIEFNQSTYQFYYLDFEEKTTALQRAIRTSIFSGATVHLGRVSLRGILGAYLPIPKKSVITAPIYIKLGLQVDLLKESRRIRPFIGIYLKSHAAVAQYLALTTGVGF